MAFDSDDDDNGNYTFLINESRRTMRRGEVTRNTSYFNIRPLSSVWAALIFAHSESTAAANHCRMSLKCPKSFKKWQVNWRSGCFGSEDGGDDDDEGESKPMASIIICTIKSTMDMRTNYVCAVPARVWCVCVCARVACRMAAGIIGILFLFVYCYISIGELLQVYFPIFMSPSAVVAAATATTIGAARHDANKTNEFTQTRTDTQINRTTTTEEKSRTRADEK